MQHLDQPSTKSNYTVREQPFSRGFIAGWRLIAGAHAAVPVIPPERLEQGMTHYRSGVKLGVEAGKTRKGIVRSDSLLLAYSWRQLIVVRA